MENLRAATRLVWYLKLNLPGGTYSASIGILANNLVQHGVGNALLHDTVMVIVSGMGTHSWVGVVSQVRLCGGGILFHFGTGQNQWSCSVWLQSKQDAFDQWDFG